MGGEGRRFSVPLLLYLSLFLLLSFSFSLLIYPFRLLLGPTVSGGGGKHLLPPILFLLLLLLPMQIGVLPAGIDTREGEGRKRRRGCAVGGCFRRTGGKYILTRHNFFWRRMGILLEDIFFKKRPYARLLFGLSLHMIVVSIRVKTKNLDSFLKQHCFVSRSNKSRLLLDLKYHPSLARC